MPVKLMDIHQRFIMIKMCVLLHYSSYNIVTAMAFTLVGFLITKHFSSFTIKNDYYGFYEIIRIHLIIWK